MSSDAVRRFHPALMGSPTRSRRSGRGCRVPASVVDAGKAQVGAESAAAKLLRDAAAEAMLWTLESGLRGTQLLLGAVITHEDHVVQQLLGPASAEGADASGALVLATDERERRGRVMHEEQQRLQEQLWRARIDLGDRDLRAPPPPSPKRVYFDAWRARHTARNMAIGRRFRAAAHSSTRPKLSGFRRWHRICLVRGQLGRLTSQLLLQSTRRALREWSSQRRQRRLAQLLGGVRLALRRRLHAWRSYASGSRLQRGMAEMGSRRARSRAWTMLRGQHSWPHGVAVSRSELRLAGRGHPPIRRATSALRALWRRWRLFAARAAAGAAAAGLEQSKLLPQRRRFEASIEAYRALAERCKEDRVWEILRVGRTHIATPADLERRAHRAAPALPTVCGGSTASPGEDCGRASGRWAQQAQSSQPPPPLPAATANRIAAHADAAAADAAGRLMCASRPCAHLASPHSYPPEPPAACLQAPLPAPMRYDEPPRRQFDAPAAYISVSPPPLYASHQPSRSPAQPGNLYNPPNAAFPAAVPRYYRGYDSHCGSGVNCQLLVGDFNTSPRWRDDASGALLGYAIGYRHGLRGCTYRWWV